jgi:hypothetical protein
MNHGGEGRILVSFYTYHNANTYERTHPNRLNVAQSLDIEQTFDKVDYLSGEITFDVMVIA